MSFVIGNTCRLTQFKNVICSKINQMKSKKNKTENGYEACLKPRRAFFLISSLGAAKYKLILDRFKENG